ncbi:MAG: SusD/RagB family nutrient-binding outer membrane lipoprotein [Pedobacter sp.]|nr:SusD/RagB family nutrient-binding outer membrane lipoprotein [Pedobacter sp.]
MKFNKKYNIGLLALGMLLVTGCTKDFEAINTNPTAYTQSSFDPNYTLTTAQLGYTGSTDFAYDTWRGNLIYSSTMIQGFSTVLGYWAGDKYLLNEGYLAAYWGTPAVGAYVEQVKPIVDLVEFTRTDPKYSNLYQAARIWKALVFARLTDLYGDVPYKDAGKGFYTGNYAPKYDKQQDIYTDLLKEVDEASAALVVGGNKITGDAIFQGDIAKWKTFGNSIMLRLAMRLTKVDENLAKTYLTKAVGKTMTSNADNAFLVHDVSGARVTQNRNSQILLGDGGQETYYVKWSDTFINLLKSKTDPRLGKVAVLALYANDGTKTQNTNFITTPALQKGMPNGKDLSGIAGRDVRQDASFTTFNDYSGPHPAMTRRTGPTLIMTYAETELLWAEAAQRYAVGGSAATHYNNGVKAAMTYLGTYDASLAVSGADADIYLLANPYVAVTGLQQINTQYWLHTNTMLDFYESWSNWRRSGFPVLTPVVYPNNATSGTIPRRFVYPVEEKANDAVNYNEAVSRLTGGDKLTSRVWWDK